MQWCIGLHMVTYKDLESQVFRLNWYFFFLVFLEEEKTTLYFLEIYIF